MEAAQNSSHAGFRGQNESGMMVDRNLGVMIINNRGKDTLRKRHEEEKLAEEVKQVKEEKAVEQRALQSLAFLEMHSRENDTDTEAAPDTCSWILEHQTYKDWLSARDGLLWIQGKPGVGKTTLLKYALQECRTSAAAEKTTVISYFFTGRGASIQKNAIGMLRSLLYQTLNHFPHLLRKFSTIYKNKIADAGKSGKKWEWEAVEMRKHLQYFLGQASLKQHIRIYVDALDESGENSARELVKYFRRTTANAPPNGFFASICFSCRTYPLNFVEDSLTICVENENYLDIVKVLENELDGIHKTQAEELAQKIVNRASGVFQWVVLVVPKLLKMYLKGSSKASDRQRQD